MPAWPLQHLPNPMFCTQFFRPVHTLTPFIESPFHFQVRSTSIAGKERKQRP